MIVYVVTDDCNEFLGLASGLDSIASVIFRRFPADQVKVTTIGDGEVSVEVTHGDGSNTGDGRSSIWDYRYWEEEVVGGKDGGLRSSHMGP